MAFLKATPDLLCADGIFLTTGVEKKKVLQLNMLFKFNFFLIQLSNEKEQVWKTSCSLYSQKFE